MNHPALTELLLRLCQVGEHDALAKLVLELGFTEPKKTVANLISLQENFQDCTLLAEVVLAALPSADPDLALNNLERLLTTATGEDLAAVLADAEARRRLLTVLGASPFLTGILCRRATFFHDLFNQGEFDRSKDETTMLAELRQLIPSGVSFIELQQGLRRYKCREMLRIGSRDLCGLATLQEVTGELSALAAGTLQRALEICEELLQADFGAPLLDDPPGCAGEFTVLGMGKFGGRELNFSSDIDLIYFYASERGKTAGLPDPLGGRRSSIPLHTYYVKLAEMLSRAIGQATEDGFVFRVDLRLRPDGNSGEMANSLRGAEVYYESWGQSWERAAMIKARPVAGSIALGERLLKALEPFVYRRYLDYGMLEDIKGMKQKIDRSLTREREGELNLKLGRGGIREIEFFIQALQLIYGGKHPALRERNSLHALELLRREGLVKETDARLLHEAYTFLRTVEHRIQVVQERQTHALPVRPEEMRALARRCGFADEEAFRSELERHRQGVAAIFHDLFYSEEERRDEVRPEIALLFDRGVDSDLVKDLLEEKGFRNPDGAYECLLTLRDGPAHAHLTQRSRRQLERIAPQFLQEVIDSPEPDMAMLNLERFLSALRARATFFALLAENREIIKVLVSLFATSQFLSRIFIQHPEILDYLVSGSYAVFLKDRAAMAKELAELLALASDYEEKLEVLRRYRKEEFLRIAMSDLQGHMAQEEGTLQLSALAEVLLQQALAIAREELLPRFGLPWSKGEDGSEQQTAFAIIGMGKLGGQELNYHSDLDIIFIYQGEGETRPAAAADSERFRPLSNQEYFSKLAQRTISVLTLMTREGYVYQIDTRLRPSGNQGPLVTSLSAYQRYHQASAQSWERQALAKARVVAGPEAFARQIAESNCRIVYQQPLPANLREEIFRLRARMETEIAREGSEHFNIKTGRGGMVDVEFIAQYLQLLHGGSRPKLRQANTLAVLRALREEALLGEKDFLVLDSGYRFLRRLENRLRLVHDQSINELSGERAYLVKLARRLGYPDRPRRPDEVFLEEYRAVTEKIRAVFERLLGPQLEEGMSG
jgi:[glutamine synthetase] adenylyltransferase / [glutamine synthetase]-adenylyl-L-tyrosine phosphorylase